MIHRHRHRQPWLSLIASTWCALGALAAGDSGMGISPGIVLIEDAPVGTRLDLGAQGLRIAVRNGSDEAMGVTVSVSAPAATHIREFEAGYEPIPDPGWVHLEHSELTIPAHGTGTTGVIVDIPDRPELMNRHFMVFVETGPSIHAGLGAVLRVRARLMVETTIDPHPHITEHAAAIAVSPGRVAMERRADGTWSGQTEVVNHGSETASYDVLTLSQAYGAGEEDRRDRFVGGRQTALTRESWVVPDSTSFVLEPGAARTIHWTGTPARPLRADERVDEVLFIARRAAPGTPPALRRSFHGADYDRTELVRLRYAAPEPSPATPTGSTPSKP
jgi:hypothetical protein